MNSWAELVSSPDRDTYQCRWDTFDDTYGFNYPELILYLKDTWLELKKVLFIRAQIDQYLHFGNRATSRVEDLHSILKSYLQVSTSDLRTVYEKITLLLVNEHVKFEAGIAQDRT